MTKVTVLVAAYNAAPFLPKCLDSLMNQTLHDIQVVCVDDASTDQTLQVLNQYALRDLRIDIVRLDKNHGPAYARNEGLKLAKGEFVCMVDADDWLSADALQKAVEAFDDETDCVLFDVVMYDEGRETHYPLPPYTSLSGAEAFRLSLDWQLHGLYMIRADIHMRYPYDATCRLFSDDNTTRVHYLASRRVSRCTGCYYYRQHAASSTHKVSVRRFDYLKANESMRRQMQDMGVSQALINEYENHRWLNLIDVYMFWHVHGRELPLSDRQYGLQELRRAWDNVDRTALNKKTTAKFGYRPCRSWQQFRLQEWLYFTLRGFLGKNV